MITNAKDFYASIQGKRVAFCGIGGSNLPLISIFQKKGAVVLACDKRDREKLGETGEKLENQGVELHLGEAYLPIRQRRYPISPNRQRAWSKNSTTGSSSSRSMSVSSWTQPTFRCAAIPLSERQSIS